jgi:CubicO group peptidase (beta-lactamase class C family)
MAADETTTPIMPGWPYDRPDYTSLAAAVQGEAARWNVPGIATAILHADGTIETASAGLANLRTRMPMVDDTISQIGSISKVFTTTLAMMLVDDGVLELDTPIIKWMPDLPLADTEARDQITLRHLLSHTAGFEGDRFIDYGPGDDALATAIAGYGSLRQWTRPGDLWHYCNTGFYLVSRLVEVVTGEVFEDVFRARIIEPLGLDTTFFFADQVIGYPHAVGHNNKGDRSEGPQVSSQYSLPRYVNGCGGVVCSTRELLRFAQLHLGLGELDGTRLLSEKSARAMQTPETEAGDLDRHYALGWCVHTYPEFRTISHGGATNGFRAQLTVLPDHNVAIATLCNGDAGVRAQAEIEAWALNHVLGLTRPTLPLEKHSPKHLASFAGTYERHDGTYTVSVEGDHLNLSAEIRDEETGEVEMTAEWPLLPVGDAWYVVPDGVGKWGRVDFIRYEGNGEPELFMRRGGRLAVRAGDAPKPKGSSKGKKKVDEPKPVKKKRGGKAA